MTSAKRNRWHTKKRTSADRVRNAKYTSPPHLAARRAFSEAVEAGIARCWRCGALLVPGKWHVGHDDVQTDVIRGPECATCNLRAAARKGSKVAHAVLRRRRAEAEFKRAER